VVDTLQTLVVLLGGGFQLVLHLFILQHGAIEELKIVLRRIVTEVVVVAEQVQVPGEFARGTELFS
jgi:hypothetical protein